MLFFHVTTPLGFPVHTSMEYMQKILSKHPDLEGREDEVKQALSTPHEVRRSRRDGTILLFYRPSGKHWLEAVAKRLNGDVTWSSSALRRSFGGTGARGAFSGAGAHGRAWGGRG